AMYWAEKVAAQKDDPELAAQFAELAKALAASEKTILTELAEVQGVAVDIHGYYHPDMGRVEEVMRPSPTLNAIIDG
ncbi:MAG: NADP-dependent isocitrate dehydrogenase, partial [Pseudomonadales bacterium]|nr:NADP-dependent isocitrate dehydrogenase [Pseudomonadales bacterium]